MSLIEAGTGKRIKGEVQLLEDTDSGSIVSRFAFNWEKKRIHTVYKLRVVSSKQIIRLISISDFAQEYRIHINLLELSKENVGPDKRYLNAAGYLIAFCCRLSFRSGYDGFVSLVPKTLIS